MYDEKLYSSNTAGVDFIINIPFTKCSEKKTLKLLKKCYTGNTNNCHCFNKENKQYLSNATLRSSFKADDKYFLVSTTQIVTEILYNKKI